MMIGEEIGKESLAYITTGDKMRPGARAGSTLSRSPPTHRESGRPRHTLVVHFAEAAKIIMFITKLTKLM